MSVQLNFRLRQPRGDRCVRPRCTLACNSLYLLILRFVTFVVTLPRLNWIAGEGHAKRFESQSYFEGDTLGVDFVENMKNSICPNVIATQRLNDGDPVLSIFLIKVWRKGLKLKNSRVETRRMVLVKELLREAKEKLLEYRESLF